MGVAPSSSPAYPPHHYAARTLGEELAAAAVRHSARRRKRAPGSGGHRAELEAWINEHADELIQRCRESAAQGRRQLTVCEIEKCPARLVGESIDSEDAQRLQRVFRGCRFGVGYTAAAAPRGSRSDRSGSVDSTGVRRPSQRYLIVAWE